MHLKMFFASQRDVMLQQRGSRIFPKEFLELWAGQVLAAGSAGVPVLFLTGSARCIHREP